MQFCRNCFHVFSSNEALEKHLTSCLTFDAAIVQLPKEEQKFYKFHNFKALWFAPLVVYFDLESFLAPMTNSRGQSTIFECHKPSGYALAIVDHFKASPVHFELEANVNCMQTFIERLHKIARELYYKKRRFPSYAGEVAKTGSIMNCWICQQEMPEQDCVLNHCHYSGKFLG